MSLIIEKFPEWKDTDTDGKLKIMYNRILASLLGILGILAVIGAIGMLNFNYISGSNLTDGIVPMVILWLIAMALCIFGSFFEIRFEKTKGR
ncbi:hypothetical protein LCGC14_2940460 [marine sediment metagenome]|uniref:Uncharacterized protein n=1 Tax=marine sediment metagenome TaxID=412755 RepID=A0A0F9A994_9ZZZZ